MQGRIAGGHMERDRFLGDRHRLCDAEAFPVGGAWGYFYNLI